MTKKPTNLLIFIKDFTERSDDTFYWFHDKTLTEISAKEVVDYPGQIICHDFWMIRDTLFAITGSIPHFIIDLDEFRISTSGIPEDRTEREKKDITRYLSAFGIDQETCDTYQKILNKKIPFDKNVISSAANALLKMYDRLCLDASDNNEYERFFSVEIPAYRAIQLSMAQGVMLDTSQLSIKRADAEHEYFVKLKEYSQKHDMPIETPSRRALERKLIKEGFTLDDVSLEYLLEFIPHPQNFGSETLELLDSDNARKMLSSITLSTEYIQPIVDTFGSRTSRIQLRSPNLQNLPKKYRTLIKARPGHQISYVDFDQFEVGIMAALSGDDNLKRLYEAGDMYEIFSRDLLNIEGNRKAAKQLFLSYAYGMSRNSLIDAAVSLGIDRKKAKDAFQNFQGYEAWKKTIFEEFKEKNRISTVLGNHYKRKISGQLTNKEQRSVVSQVVQGTGSLIFKRAIIETSKIKDLKITLPMHDALLFEYTVKDTPDQVVKIFTDTMTDVLQGKIIGKASVGNFFET